MTLGAKTILIASIAAFLSHAFNWVSLGMLSASGFSQTGCLFMLFFAYPLYCALTDKKIHLIGGLISAAIAVMAGMWYIGLKKGEIFGSSYNAAGGGVYLFIFCSLALAFGVYKLSSEQKQSDA